MLRLKRRLMIAAGAILTVGLIAWLLHSHPLARIDSYQQCARQGYPIAETEPPTCSDGRHTFLGPRSSPLVSPEPAVAQEFSLLVDGDSGGTYPQRSEVISNQTDWRRYWNEVHASLPAIPPILPVDFTTNDVIALSLGRQMTGGYSFKVTGVTTNHAGTSIQTTQTIPGAGCAVTQAISNRYFIVRTAKLTEPVSFRATTEHRRCDR